MKDLFKSGPCLLLVSIVLTACGGSPPLPPTDTPEARREVSDMFLHFRQRIQENQVDSLIGLLASESLNWLDDIRRASRSEPLSFLEQRPFHEILSILALRVERRLNPGFDDRPPSLLRKLILEAAPVRKAFLKTDLGEPHVWTERAEIGLREAPNVPVFYFIRQDHAWKFHLVRSLPMILMGAETLGRQRKPTRLLQAIFILEQFGGKTVLPEDLHR